MLQKLCEFLIEYQEEGETQRKEIFLPTIYTKQTPFVGATLKRLQMKTTTYRIPRESNDDEEELVVGEAEAKATATARDLPVRHKVELDGPLLPETIIELSKLFEETQSRQFTAHLYPFSSTQNVNKLLASTIPAATAAKGQLPSVSGNALEDPVHFTQAIQKAQFLEGIYSVELN